MQVLRRNPLAPRCSVPAPCWPGGGQFQERAVGRIVSVRFKEGTKVRKGDLLVRSMTPNQRAVAQGGEAIEWPGPGKLRQRTLAYRDLISREELKSPCRKEAACWRTGTCCGRNWPRRKSARPSTGWSASRRSARAATSPGTRIAACFSLRSPQDRLLHPGAVFRPGQGRRFHPHRAWKAGRSPVMGTVYAVEPKVDPATRMLRIRGYCPNPKRPNPPRGLGPGGTAPARHPGGHDGAGQRRAAGHPRPKGHAVQGRQGQVRAGHLRLPHRGSVAAWRASRRETP